MKITQGYSSITMNVIGFLKMHKLRLYDNMNEPLVVFGCYSDKDVETIKNHKSIVVVQWEGLDSKMKSNPSIFTEKNIINVSPHPNIKKYLDSKGIQCHLIKWAIDETLQPQILGNKVYSYVNKKTPVYYGGTLINKLNIPFEILIGDYSISHTDWRTGGCDEFYPKCFIGLALSEYAGGGTSIVELGLRGIKVITNILNLPHTIKWNTIKDIEDAINKEAENIGKINTSLAGNVYNNVLSDEKLKCYDLDQLII